MSLYTKKGDRGETGLPGGRRLSKTELLIELLGSLDQANASIGLAISLLKPTSELIKPLQDVQRDLLATGAYLAASDRNSNLIMTHYRVLTRHLESQIDRWDKLLPPLANFILPGGSPAASALHLSRGPVRAAERCFHRLKNHPGAVSAYLNRLSDYFFQAARIANLNEGVKDKIWRQQKNSKS